METKEKWLFMLHFAMVSEPSSRLPWPCIQCIQSAQSNLQFMSESNVDTKSLLDASVNESSEPLHWSICLLDMNELTLQVESEWDNT